MAFLAVLLVLACSVLSVAGHAEPHPLSRINLGNMRTQLDGGVSAAAPLTRTTAASTLPQPQALTAASSPVVCLLCRL